MVVTFDNILVTEVVTGTSKKTGREWGRLQFFDGSSTWSIFVPSDYIGVLSEMKVGQQYTGFRCLLRPSFSGGVELVPTV